MSSCPVGKNCIQGTPTLNQDSSINATYSSSSLVADDVLTFSGFGLTTDYGFSAVWCMEDSEIPGNNPGTFITEFKIGNSQWIECNRPTAPSGYTQPALEIMLPYLRISVVSLVILVIFQ